VEEDREGDRTRGVGAEGSFAGLLGRRHGEEGEEAQVGEAVAAAQGHHLAFSRFGGSLREGFGGVRGFWGSAVHESVFWCG